MARASLSKSPGPSARVRCRRFAIALAVFTFAATAFSQTTVSMQFQRITAGPSTVSFGLPIRSGVVSDVSRIRVRVGGSLVDAHIKPLLYHYDASGTATSLRAVEIQFPATIAVGSTTTAEISLNEAGPQPASDVVPFSQLSFDSSETATVADRTIINTGGTYKLQESNVRTLTLFTAREPNVIATFPKGYLAQSGILGPQVTAEDVANDPQLAGVVFLSQNLNPFLRSADYEDGYAYNPDPDSVYDPVANYEGWLYDRCTTLLTGHAHTGDASVLRHALRTCSYYSSKIVLAGENRGIFSGKPDPDTKYSHLRGLYAYYAITGDEGALASGKAIADLWNSDQAFAAPYRQGHIRGSDKLWTERLLGTSMEGLYYGFRLTGDRKYLDAFLQMLDTAYRHITTSNQAELTTINLDPNTPPFPPQNCWIHNAEQHGENSSNQPWCSGWMSELVIDNLLAYQAQTNDPRVDEIFIRLGRFLRDVGSGYFRGNPLGDTFAKPSACFDATDTENPRILTPLYGSGLFADGSRANFGEYDDFEHCTDATALTAAAIRALVRQGKFNSGGPSGPFPSEGAAMLQLHHEFSFCSQYTFGYHARTRRDPRVWTSEQLASGASNPASFIQDNKIGWPVYQAGPQRKLSWWFNMSMLQFALLRDAGISIRSLQPGAIQAAGLNCPGQPSPTLSRRRAVRP